MRSGSWSKILWMTALLPLFAVSVLPTHLRTLICRVTGAVMAVETCCPADDPIAQAGTEAVISETGAHQSIAEEGCCVVKTVDLGRPPAEHRSSGPPPSSQLPVISALPTVGVTLAARPLASARQDRPPPSGPPLLLLKRSFLI